MKESLKKYPKESLEKWEEFLLPYQWAWEGLRRNPEYIQISELMDQNPTGSLKIDIPFPAAQNKNDESKPVRKTRKKSGKDTITITKKIWGEEEVLKFGLRKWLPIDTPRKKISHASWDSRFVASFLTVLGPGLIPEKLDKEQQIAILDSRIPLEHQLWEIEYALREMGCPPKRRKPKDNDKENGDGYSIINESLAVYDLTLQPGMSDSEIIDKVCPHRCAFENFDDSFEDHADLNFATDLKHLSHEERLERVEKHKKEISLLESRRAERDSSRERHEQSAQALIEYRRNYALIFIGAVDASEKKNIKSPIHYLDLLKYRAEKATPLWGEKTTRPYKKSNTGNVKK